MSRSFKRTNERRIELIRKKHREGLSLKEERELERVSGWVNRWVDQRHPIDTTVLEELRRQVMEIVGQ